MKFFFYACFLIFLFSCNEKKLETKAFANDSITYYLNQIKSGALPAEKSLLLNEKALRLAEFQKRDTIWLKNLYSIANNFFILNENRRFFETTQKIQESAIRSKDTLNIAKTYVYLAEYYKKISSNDSSLFFYVKAEKYYKKINDFKNLSDLFIRKADLQAIENDFFGSEKSSLEALSLLRVSPDSKIAYEAFNLIGISSTELGSYTKAIEYFNKALSVVNELQPDDQLYYKAISLNNLGNAYQNLGDYDEAIKYYNQALLLRDVKSKYLHLYAVLLDNVAYSKFKKRNYGELPQQFFESLKINEDLGILSKVVLVNIHLSEFYLTTGDTLQSIIHAERALEKAKIEKFPSDVLFALKQLALVDKSNSASLSTEYIRINDSIRIEERQMEDKFARIQFETDEISLQREKLAEQNRDLLYFFAGTLFIGVLLFVIRSQRAKNRELLLRQAQQKANEDIYNLMISQQDRIEESRIKEKKRIAQELHDGVLGRLFGTRLNLDSLNKATDVATIERRNSYLAELKNIEQDIREISHDLNREKYVIINNFLAIINNLIEEQINSFSSNVSYSIDGEIKWEELPNTVKINIFRVLQESLQNINKYAQASNVVLSIKKINDKLEILISDNGIGFTVTNKSKGIGLQNIITRIQQINGKVEIKSKKGKGTTLIIQIPLETEIVDS